MWRFRGRTQTHHSTLSRALKNYVCESRNTHTLNFEHPRMLALDICPLCCSSKSRIKLALTYTQSFLHAVSHMHTALTHHIHFHTHTLTFAHIHTHSHTHWHSHIRAYTCSHMYSHSFTHTITSRPELLKGVYGMGFNRPSKIQEKALPLLLADPPSNLIAQSQSGTGKTAAFVLAMLSRVDPAKKHPQVGISLSLIHSHSLTCSHSFSLN